MISLVRRLKGGNAGAIGVLYVLKGGQEQDGFEVCSVAVREVHTREYHELVNYILEALCEVFNHGILTQMLFLSDPELEGVPDVDREAVGIMEGK